MKYIVFEGNQAVLIPKESGMNHSDIRFVDNYGTKWKPVSAGFCYLNEDGAKCYGESTSLKLKSKESDSQIINRLFYEYI
jgi:hypothetical protein